MAQEQVSGRYLYAVVPAGDADKLKIDATGVHGGEVYPLTAGSVAAIVSNIEPETLRPERKHLAAHSEVLRQVLEQSPMLPVAFGIVAGSERELRNILSEHEGDFTEQLREVDRQVEMGLRGKLNVPNVFEYFIKVFPELRNMRDSLFSQGEPTREQKIDLGKTFVDMLNGFRDTTVGTVQRNLEGAASKIKVLEPRNEQEVLYLAALLPRDQVEAFTKKVEALGPKLDENLQLDLTGPWPPYNFVELRIHLEGAPQEAPA